MTNLSKKQKLTDIPDAIKLYLSEKNTNQAQLGRDANVGEAYVSYILKGKTYIGATEIKDKYYLALCKAIGYSLEATLWQHFNTNNFKLMINAVKKARTNKERLVLDADTGGGKTYMCTKYKQKYPNNTFVVKCSAIENSKEFAINIGEVVGVETHGTAGAIVKRIVKKITLLEDVILIIDEAEHIGKKSGYINITKSLADLLEDKVAMVLVGMGISDILKKGFDRNKQNFRQTARRFSNRSKCDTNIAEDVVKIAEELGIKNKPAQNWLAARMQNFDELRILITQVIEESLKERIPITTNLLNTFYYDV